ncbi:hypothetical protein CYLTODRAFT_203485 [Cylindrobasidium torrendii FP15055 ss-10]|uniref:Uncharacterized protein n=1 Tax=Cylindrobasidium torrendii FP15055 ss-10 TaxID=1314674 RepID=A0A0D7AUY7_9AGAR|nr:hypothetical protein CYLTODRAFT_203485 [Cylindrobasidium torrendii FP15055 ss-10]
MIEKRLTALGWGDELSHPKSMAYLRSHNLYCKIRPLSEQDWQKVQKVFVDYMTMVKRYRVTGERLKLFESVTCDYLTSQIDVAPPWSTIAQAFPFYGMIFDTDVDSDDVTEATMHAALCAYLPTVTGEWRSTVESKLIEKLYESKLSPHLSLASSSFSCPECSNCLHYPQILEHDCLLNASVQTNEDEGTYTLGTFLYDSMSAPTKRKVLIADALVRLCGGDPETATATWLDEQNKFFTCGGCWQPDTPARRLDSAIYGRWRYFMSDHKRSWCSTHGGSSALRVVHESKALRVAMKMESKADTPAICKMCERHFRPGKWDEHLLRHDHHSSTSGSDNEWRERWHPMTSKEHHHYPSNYCDCDEERGWDWDWDSI